MSDHQGRRGRLGGAWPRWLAEAAATRRGRESERLRNPQPLVRRRLPSGRGAIEQPNIATDWEAAHNPRFWAMVALTGVATGLLGDLMMALLFNVQYLAFGYHSGSLQAAIEHAAPLRRVSSLLIAGAFGGVAWYLLRRCTKGEHSEIDDVIWDGDGQLSFRRCLGTSLISEVVIGMGASLGREAAPKLLGGASASALASWAGLSTQQKRLLVACGGGAGLAAVYNVPLGGALFTAEILCGTIALPIMLPALACSGIATLTAWIYLPAHATYLNIPQYPFSGSLMVWALLAGPVLGLISAGYIRLIGWVSHHRATGLKALFAPVLAFGILGVIGIWYPELFGNGKDMASDAFTGVGALGLLLALSALKPLVTVLCLGSGASGGLFTPTLSTGAVLGGAFGIAWSLAWPGSPAGAFAMIGAAAMVGAAMQAPITALALVLELTHSGFGLMVPMLAATVTATAVAFYVDGYSIYSARLPSRPPGWRSALLAAQPGAGPAPAPQPICAGRPGDGASPAAAADDGHHSRAEHPPDPGAPGQARRAGDSP
jgi:H+/Cl- antiporter ClcA